MPYAQYPSCKRVLLLSDSHGNKDAVRYILHGWEGACDLVIFCGDGVRDLASLVTKPCIMVRGNNDSASVPYKDGRLTLSETCLVRLFNRNIMVTHGHRYSLYTNVASIVTAAKDNKASVVLFGHLHIVCDRTFLDIRLISPGSCSLPRDGAHPTFAILQEREGKLVSLVHRI